MNEQREEKTPGCCFHPKQQLVGVCPLCLNERLLVLAAKQGNNQQRHQPRRTKHQSVIVRRYGDGESAHLQGKRSAVRFVRVCWGSHDESVDQIQGTSLEDRFISIKFEKNRVASWEETRVSKVPLEKWLCEKRSEEEGAAKARGGGAELMRNERA